MQCFYLKLLPVTISDKGVSFNISDCGFQQSSFEAYSNNSRITIEKNDKPTYNVTEGQLMCLSMTSTDRIEAQSSASIEYGKSCFQCLTINPEGVYWHNNKDLRKDFGVRIPNDAMQFNLCLKKDAEQKFGDYDGLIDFTKNEIFLSKIVEFLKYPFRNGQLSSLLMAKLFEDKADYKAYMKMTHDFAFVDSLSIEENANNSNSAAINNEKTVTNPNNYLELKEKTIGTVVHRLVKINPTISKEKLEDSRVAVYKTDYFRAEITIKNNVAIQENIINRITILPPEDAKIEEIVN